jgi:hypothetical protein
VGREQPHSLSTAVDSTMPQVRYERELTVGSIGALWLGRLTTGNEAGRTVLLRRMPHDLFSKKDLDALTKVAEAYAKVRHPSLVKLLGVIVQDRDIISVSEHLDGVRLSDILRNAIDHDAPLPATVVVRIVLDAARATIKAHRLAAESGLFPAQRLFLPEGVFVASFGGTLLTEVGVLATIARCTQPLCIPDLVAQLAPEEVDKTHASCASPEVFSLGVLLWEALANRRLFSRDTMRQTLEELQRLPIDPLDSIERCGMPVPEALAAVVRIATLRQPNLRYASLDQLVSALEQLPAHFIATEHHVAGALRSQAADLLKAFHVDPSQTSLTLAFSGVPASRMSTRPPPASGHNWEPPTFAQSKLVADFRTSIGTLPALEQAELPAVGVTSISSELRDPPRHGVYRQRHWWIALLLLAVVAFFLVARFVKPKLHPPVQPELPASHTTTDKQPTQRSDLPGNVAPASSTSSAELESPDRPLPSEPRGTNQKASIRGTPSESSDSNASVTPSPSKKPGPAYRPHQIEPYRPKGI